MRGRWWGRLRGWIRYVARSGAGERRSAGSSRRRSDGRGRHCSSSSRGSSSSNDGRGSNAGCKSDAGDRRDGLGMGYGVVGGAKSLSKHVLEFLELLGGHVEDPFKVAAHFTFHLVDLTKGEHALADDAPTLVGVSVITDDL
jgi:hypothetical protein